VDGQTVRTAAWTVYLDGDRETRSAQGFAVESSSSSSSSSGGDLPSYDYTLVNPVSIQKRNASGTRSESIQATRASNSGKLSASDTFAQSSYVRWSVSIANAAGQQIATRAYHTIPASGDGSTGTNYDETTFGYDFMGRQNRVTSPGGTISRTVFDTRGRVVCSYVGTDDSGATDTDPTSGREPCSQTPSGSSSSSSSSGTDPNNNMVLVSEQTYHDTDCAGCSGGGGQLASSTQYVDADTTRTTEFFYDWRNRREYVIAPPDDQDRTVYTRYQFNNLDQVVRVERYQEQYPNADVLISRQESYFDDLGRTYETRRYAVDPDTGTVGNYLAGYSWFDAAGNSIKQQGEGQRSFTKTQFDSLGRAVKQFVGYDQSETPGCTINNSSSSSSSSGEAESYTVATNVAGDTILEQTETEFDAAGNVLVVASRQRRHDTTGTGELSTMSGSQPQARVSYVANWFDEVGRQKAVANYGTNGDSALTRPNSVPSRSDAILVTTTEFNSAGNAYKTIDPAGREDRQEFDDAGRVVKSIQNYQDGVVNSSYPDEDVTVETAYTADGQVATLTAKNPATGDQVTTYVYGTTLDDSEIARSDLLRAEIYPDSDDVADPLGNGVDGVFDRVEFKYNRQGERIEKKDQNGTVHVYEFDPLGRVIHDRVTTLGTGIDGAVRRTSTTYEVRGMREKVTSCDNATVGSGSVVNEVVFDYNDLGQLVKEYQEHEGAKDANTLYLQYNFDESASGGKFTKGLRPSSVRYPNGRLVHLTYGSTDSMADVLNRLDAIKDDSSGSPGDVLASYSYLGLGTIVVEDYQQPDVRLEYFFNSAYSGFDRFGRVVDQRWYDYGASADRDRYTYGYDRASNRTYRENTMASGKDEFYSYDGVNRLVNLDRGDLNVGKTAISGMPVREEDWNLDMTGNWSGYVQKTSGSTDLDQDRTHNDVNEITDISKTTGTAWATPVHDRAGNMMSVPKPAALASSLTLKWDAWNRLVEAKDGATVIGVYEYDAANRRVKRHIDSQAPNDPNGVDTYLHYFYNSAWQVLESRDTTTESDQPENLQPKYQYIWSPRYIDAPVLRDKNMDTDGLCDDERIYFLGDANFNVTTLIDMNGDAVERYLYDAYGRVTVYDEAWANVRGASSYGNVMMYAGRDRDTETGLYQYRHRYYAAELGRFVSRDPIGYWGGINLYRYVRDNPLRRTDPSGTCTSCAQVATPSISPAKPPLAPVFPGFSDSTRRMCDKLAANKSTGDGSFTTSDLSPADDTNCKAMWRNALACNPWLEPPSGTCSITVACKKCSGPWGGWSIGSKGSAEITICWSPNMTQDEMKKLMQHEGTHALQQCQDWPKNNGKYSPCEAAMYSEIMAYRNEDECTDYFSCVERALGSNCRATNSPCNGADMTPEMLQRLYYWFNNMPQKPTVPLPPPLSPLSLPSINY
jgi:RHS repeat-associated protein